MSDTQTQVRTLFDMRFDSQAALNDAFLRVGEQPRVISCSLESEQLRLRYVLTGEDAAVLAERIYLAGGLRWCSRHVLPESGALDSDAHSGGSSA